MLHLVHLLPRVVSITLVCDRILTGCLLCGGLLAHVMLCSYCAKCKWKPSMQGGNLSRSLLPRSRTNVACRIFCVYTEFGAQNVGCKRPKHQYMVSVSLCPWQNAIAFKYWEGLSLVVVLPTKNQNRRERLNIIILNNIYSTRVSQIIEPPHPAVPMIYWICWPPKGQKSCGNHVVKIKKMSSFCTEHVEIIVVNWLTNEHAIWKFCCEHKGTYTQLACNHLFRTRPHQSHWATLVSLLLCPWACPVQGEPLPQNLVCTRRGNICWLTCTSDVLVSSDPT